MIKIRITVSDKESDKEHRFGFERKAEWSDVLAKCIIAYAEGTLSDDFIDNIPEKIKAYPKYPNKQKLLSQYGS